MQPLAHNAFPLRFGMRNRLAALWAAGHFSFSSGEFYGEDSFEEILNDQEEDSFEKVPQVAKQNPVKEICQRDCQDCVPKISQGTGKGKASCPGTALIARPMKNPVKIG